MRKNGRFFLHLTVQKEVDINIPSDPNKLAVIAIDIGEANPLTSVVLRDGGRIEKPMFLPMFLAKEIRTIRARYNRIS